MILFGLSTSPPVNKVRFLLHALEIPYEFRTLNIVAGEGQKQQYLALHPAGKIPVLDDDGFVLFESNAILRYLADKGGSALYPSALRDRALVDQWMDFCTINIGDGVGKLLFSRVVAPFRGMPIKEQFIADGIESLARFLPLIDAQLSKHGKIAGAELTIADFNLLGILDPCEVAGIDLAPYPVLLRWRDDLRSREFYTRCHLDYASAIAAAMPALKASMK